MRSAILFLCLLFSSNLWAQDDANASFKVSATDTQALTPKEPGGTTVKVTAQIEVTNNGKDVIGISPRIFKYKLVKKKGGDEHRFFGHAMPDAKDARPLEAGKTGKLVAELEGHTIQIEKGEQYELHVSGYGKTIVVPLKFK